MHVYSVKSLCQPDLKADSGFARTLRILGRLTFYLRCIAQPPGLPRFPVLAGARTYCARKSTTTTTAVQWVGGDVDASYLMPAI